MKVGKWKLMLPLALLVMGGTVAISGALATPAQSDEVKIAIMTDCKGAFAFGVRGRYRRHHCSALPVRGRASPRTRRSPLQA